MTTYYYYVLDAIEEMEVTEYGRDIRVILRIVLKLKISGFRVITGPGIDWHSNVLNVAPLRFSK